MKGRKKRERYGDPWVLEALLGGETLGGILDEELPDEVLGCWLERLGARAGGWGE